MGVAVYIGFQNGRMAGYESVSISGLSFKGSLKYHNRTPTKYNYGGLLLYYNHSITAPKLYSNSEGA